MKKNLLAVFSLCILFFSSCSSGSKSENGTEQSSSSSKPSKDDITKAMHKQFDRPGDNFNPKHDVEIHDIKIGDTEGTNEQDKIDGIPEKADVTMAKVDFTERSYYTDKTTTRRREITAKVYKDDFGEWKVMTDASREISNADEPAKPQ